MMELESTEIFHTSRGTVCIVEGNRKVRVGQSVIINGEKHKIKKILFPSKPDDERVAIIVED